MSLLEQTFQTSYRHDYEWPYPKPMVKRPPQPPMVTPKDPSVYIERPAEGVCHCDKHLYDNKMIQYRELASKEMLLCKELFNVNRQMTKLGNEILDHPCDDDDMKMETSYQIDYNKRNQKIVPYRPIRADIDAPPCDLHPDVVISIGKGYRDPCLFRYTAYVRPTLGQDGPVSFVTTPDSIEQWFLDSPPRTTYQDDYSKVGLAVLKSLQQYKEPMPSSRRRVGDPCL